MSLQRQLLWLGAIARRASGKRSRPGEASHLLHDEVRLLVDAPADFSDCVIPAGTLGAIVKCYADPEGYAIDVALRDPTLMGSFNYENVVLTRDRFEVVESADSARAS